MSTANDNVPKDYFINWVAMHNKLLTGARLIAKLEVYQCDGCMSGTKR